MKGDGLKGVKWDGEMKMRNMVNGVGLVKQIREGWSYDVGSVQ